MVLTFFDRILVSNGNKLSCPWHFFTLLRNLFFNLVLALEKIKAHCLRESLTSLTFKVLTIQQGVLQMRLPWNNYANYILLWIPSPSRIYICIYMLIGNGSTYGHRNLELTISPLMIPLFQLCCYSVLSYLVPNTRKKIILVKTISR